MRMSEAIPGVLALLAGIVAFIVMGARDPVRSVWELADERSNPAAGTTPELPVR
jgi:hypothetical protein